MTPEITMMTLFDVLDEIELGAKDKTRTIADIDNKDVKSVILSEKEYYLKNSESAQSPNTSRAVGTSGYTIAGATAGTAITSIATAGAAASGGGSAMAFAKAGAAAGSTVGPGGVILGILGGALVGLTIGKKITEKKQNEIERRIRNEKELLFQKAISIESGALSQIEKEYNDVSKESERREYLAGLLTSYQRMLVTCGKGE